MNRATACKRALAVPRVLWPAVDCLQGTWMQRAASSQCFSRPSDPVSVFCIAHHNAPACMHAVLRALLCLHRRPKFLQHIRDESGANLQRKSEADYFIILKLVQHGRLR